MSKKVVAWKVTEEAEGHACIVFSASGVAARREGASELGYEFDEVVCRREKQFDRFAEAGRVPVRSLLEAGWWFECFHCALLIDFDNEETPSDKVITEGDRAFCSAQCKCDHEREVADRNAAFEAFKSKLPSLRPDLEFSDFIGAYPYITLSAKFRFPGGQYLGSVRDQEGDGKLQWFVAQDDKDAWEKYNAGVSV